MSRYAISPAEGGRYLRRRGEYRPERRRAYSDTVWTQDQSRAKTWATRSGAEGNLVDGERVVELTA